MHLRLLLWPLLLCTLAACSTRPAAEAPPAPPRDPTTSTAPASPIPLPTPIPPQPVETTKPARAQAESLVAEGWRLERLTEDDTAAYDRYTDALTVDPTYAEAWLHRAVVAQRLGTAASDDDMEAALALDPPAYLVDYFRARLAEHPTEKIMLYDRVSRAAPDFVPAYLSRGIALYSVRNYARAVQDLTQALALDPTQVEAYVILGSIDEIQRNYTAAFARYDQAIALDPAYGRAFYSRGRLHSLVRDDQPAAVADLARAAKLLPAAADVRCELSTAHYRNGEVDAALAGYADTIALDPDYPCSYVKRARLLMDLERYDEAVADYTAYLEREQEPIGYFERSVAYQLLGDLDAALADASQVVALKYGWPYGHQRQAEVYEAMGRRAEAAQSYTIAKDIFGSAGQQEQAAEMTARIESLAE